jgi:hypothetical protein
MATRTVGKVNPVNQDDPRITIAVALTHGAKDIANKMVMAPLKVAERTAMLADAIAFYQARLEQVVGEVDPPEPANINPVAAAAAREDLSFLD